MGYTPPPEGKPDYDDGHDDLEITVWGKRINANESNAAPPESSNGDFSPGSPQFQAGVSLGTEGSSGWYGPRIAPPPPGLPPGYGPIPDPEPVGEPPTGEPPVGEAPAGEAALPGEAAGSELFGWVALVMSVPGDGAQRDYRPFTYDNFRYNLLERTRGFHPNQQAHHVFPQKFEKNFKAIGIEINDPRYGAWWEEGDHQNQSTLYNQLWDSFFRQGGHDAADAITFARALADIFEYHVDF